MRLPSPHRNPAHRLLIAAALATATATVGLAAALAEPATTGPAAGPLAAASQPTTAPALPPVADAPPSNNPAELAADAALADRFEGLAELTFPPRVPTGPDRPYVFAQQAALLSASAWLDRYEPRYPRKVFEALQEVTGIPADAVAVTMPLPGGSPRDGGFQGQFAALSAAIAAHRDDEVSWIQLLDLHVNQMQDAQAQLSYLAGIESAPAGVPADVQAHAAFRMAQIQFDQGKESAARKSIKLALIHNPLCGEAQRLLYHRLMPANTPSFDRAQVLLSLLRANPLQPMYARDLALLLADAGMVQESLPFFELAVTTSFAQGRPDFQTAQDWAAEMYIAGLNPDAQGLIGHLLSARPDDSAAWYLDLIIIRSGQFPPAQQAKDLQRATNVMSNHVAEAVNAVRNAGTPGGGAAGALGAGVGGTDLGAAPRATTRPIESEGSFPLPDMAPAIAILTRAAATPEPTAPSTEPATQPAASQAAASRPAASRPAVDPPVANPPVAMSPQLAQARQAFIEAVADLARLEIYFARQPDAAAPLLDALRQVLPANDSLLAQLQGWQSLLAGKDDDARTTLAGVAATDPLASLGLIQLQVKNPADVQQAEAAGRKLLQDHADGLVGAFLTEGLSSQRVRLVPKATAANLQELLANFPQGLVQLSRQPARLYSVHVDPVDVGRDFGQPLLARVTIFNFGPSDLTVGDDGYVHPGVLFQILPQLGQQPGQPPPTFPAFDTLAGPVVIHQNGQIQQVVRVDQTALLAALDRTATSLFQVDGQLSTNPDARLGGYTVKFTKPFARTPVNGQAVVTAKARLSDNAASPRDRLTSLGQLQGYIKAMRAFRDRDPNVARDLVELTNVVRRARTDPTPAVRAWAAQADFSLATTDADRATVVNDLAADPDWRQRQLALLLAPAVPDPALARSVIAKLLADPQSSVRAYATADKKLLDLGFTLPLPTPTPPPARPAGAAPGGVPGGAPGGGPGGPVDPAAPPSSPQLPPAIP